jgi:hypothetical protein
LHSTWLNSKSKGKVNKNLINEKHAMRNKVDKVMNKILKLYTKTTKNLMNPFIPSFQV